MNVKQNIKSGATKVKQHVVKHKMAYAVGTAVVVSGTVMYFVGRSTASASIKNTIDSNKIQINSPTTNNTEINNFISMAMPRGHRGTNLWCNELEEGFESINQAAKELKVRRADIVDFLKGLRKDVNGYTFQDLGETVNPRDLADVAA